MYQLNGHPRDLRNWIAKNTHWAWSIVNFNDVSVALYMLFLCSDDGSHFKHNKIPHKITYMGLVSIQGWPQVWWPLNTSLSIRLFGGGGVEWGKRGRGKGKKSHLLPSPFNTACGTTFNATFCSLATCCKFLKKDYKTCNVLSHDYNFQCNIVSWSSLRVFASWPRDT